ncbi:MAG: toxic anion resistance protein [Clostridia bacterium]|nr:toxic anion resistance protein [Clostridia bacterium]
MTENNIPTLTLDPMGENATAQAPAEEKKPEIEPVVVDDSMLSDKEKEVVEDFAKKIDITNSNMVLQYGAEAQRKMAEFSTGALENVRTKDLGEIGDSISDLIGQLRSFDAEEESKGLFGFFKRTSNRIQALTTKYNKVEDNVDKIVSTLEGHQVQLLKDIAILDKLYERNLVNFKELTMYIIAGKKRLGDARTNELQALIDKATASGKPEDAQEANDFSALCDRFEKKLHDLELTRNVSIQMGPQIRLVQNNDTMMTEKIQSTIVNTIPLWKSQMVLALGMAHSQQAMQAQRDVTNMTNELLKKNADALRMGTVETAKEAERGIVDIETLKYTNEQLIATLDEVMTIQSEGREKRRQAELEMGRIEGELKQKLLEIRR